MKIDVLAQNNETGEIYDISEMVESVSWDTYLEGQPGKLTFNYNDDGVAKIYEGSPISLKVDDIGIFFGYVFLRGGNEGGKIAITAYDQTRYLKNKDTYVLSGLTASAIFLRVAQDFKLKVNVLDSPTYIVPERVNDNKTLYDIIQYGVDQTLINTGEWYFLRDNFGVIEFLNLNRLKTLHVIGDASLLAGFDFTSSIDTDSFNQVKLVKENKVTVKREVYIVKDSVNLAKWGMLQYFETLPETTNDAQMRERAERLLKLKNRKTKTLKLTCLGILGISAGSGVVLSIDSLKDEGVTHEQYFIITNCSHIFQNEMHAMQLEMMVI